jgi:hypothetical protein
MISLTEKSIDHEIKAIREQGKGNRRGDWSPIGQGDYQN